MDLADQPVQCSTWPTCSTHRRNYIEARGGSCLLLISWSFQLEQPCAFNEIESFGGFILSGFIKLYFQYRPKNITLRQYCAHRWISNWRYLQL